ncbi:hypothetical protein [Asticcacaulis sp. 201]|uniref:hypothetical protein n=1 Tax=Asticcacaulis sp. 201 TaxID=3028787 RepID=UPI002916BDFA|nr:hypothetical protein [Asticcacaulis sp. 201]MDV6329966.1 hypothetical protein [Asticcacaulis sp. 201]
MNTFFSALSLAVVLGAVGTGQPALALGGEKTASIQAPMTFDPHAAHEADADTLFWVNQPGGAKGLKTVIIPFFQIQFVQDAQANATAGGGAHSKTSVHLEGPTPDQMQAITDEVYASFVSDLKKAGLEVVSPEQARSFEAYNEIMNASKPSGQSVKGMNGVNSLFYAPTGMNFYFLPTMLPELAGGGSMTAIGNTQIIRREAELMTQSGAAVVGFRAVVDFATLSASDRKGLRVFSRTAKTAAEFGLVIKPVATQVFLITPAAKATMIDPQSRMRLELQAPLVLDSAAIRSTDENSTAGQKRGEAIGNAIGFLAGTGMSKTKSFAVEVDPQVWQSDVTGALKGVSAAAVARLKSGL